MEEEIPCRLCGKSIPKLGSQLCDSCFELKSGIVKNPTLARKILSQIKPTEVEYDSAMKVFDEWKENFGLTDHDKVGLYIWLKGKIGVK